MSPSEGAQHEQPGQAQHIQPRAELELACAGCESSIRVPSAACKDRLSSAREPEQPARQAGSRDEARGWRISRALSARKLTAQAQVTYRTRGEGVSSGGGAVSLPALLALAVGGLSRPAAGAI